MSNSVPLPYMRRTREYYEAQGFAKAYSYAHHDDAPFTKLVKPLSECRVGVVTTASVYPRKPLEPRRVESASVANAPTHLYADDLSWDKEATHTRDINSYCPIAPLQALVGEGMIGGTTEHFHCAPTEYSHRATVMHDAPELLRRLQEDGADVALLVPL